MPTSTEQTFDAERTGDAFQPHSALRTRPANGMSVSIDDSMQYREGVNADANGTDSRRPPPTPHPSSQQRNSDTWMGEADFDTSMVDDVGNMTDGEDGLTPTPGPTPTTPSTPNNGMYSQWFLCMESFPVRLVRR